MLLKSGQNRIQVTMTGIGYYVVGAPVGNAEAERSHRVSRESGQQAFTRRPTATNGKSTGRAWHLGLLRQKNPASYQTREPWW